MLQEPVAPTFLTSGFHELVGFRHRVKVVDVGANPIEGDPPYCRLLARGDAEVVGFEPNLAALGRLNAAKGPHETYLPYAIGDGQRRTLHFCDAAGMTSLLRPNPAVLHLFHGFPRWGTVLSTTQVDTVRLDDVAETEGVDFLKLDIQGAELMALSHAPARLGSALVIQAEVEFLPMYIDQPLFSEVEMFLRQAGFMFHRFFPEVTRMVRPLLLDDDIRAALGQVLWADAVFIRDLTRLEALSDRQLISLACIVHDCYGSADIALHVLAEYDRRNGARLGGDYLLNLRRCGGRR